MIHTQLIFILKILIIKKKIIAYIDEYNNKQEDKSKVVNYTDLIKQL